MIESKKSNSYLGVKKVTQVSHSDATVSTDINSRLDDGQAGEAIPRSTINASSNFNIVSTDLSESSLDVYIPSYPGSPRSVSIITSDSDASLRERSELQQAVDYLHTDFPLIDAAEVGNYKRIEELLRLKTTNVNQRDQLGRTALHWAVFCGSIRSIKLLLEAGITPDIKDSVGMTPLSICLMRNPSVAIANLLFNHGAVILPRASPMDTGLFMQFVAFCAPTYEEEKLLELLVKKGALLNDSEAPGGRQPLHIAAMGNNCRLIKKLIELGAKSNMKNHRGETPKMIAMIFKCKEAYDLLDNYDDESISSATSSNRSISLMQIMSKETKASDHSRHFTPRKVTMNLTGPKESA